MSGSSAFRALLAAAAATAAQSSRAGAPLALAVLPQAFADSYGARCLDGSPPSLYSLLAPSSPATAPLVLFLEGGGWCFNVADCVSRSKGGGGSSKGAASSMVVGGLLSADPAVNPRFFNYSLVFIHYCDGSSHTSNATNPIPTADPGATDVSGAALTHIWMRGRPNLIGYTTSKAAISGMTRSLARMALSVSPRPASRP